MEVSIHHIVNKVEELWKETNSHLKRYADYAEKSLENQEVNTQLHKEATEMHREGRDILQSMQNEFRAATDSMERRLRELESPTENGSGERGTPTSTKW